MDQVAAAADRAEAGRDEVGLGGVGVAEGRDGTSRRAHSSWTRLMSTPGYRLSDRTGISDLLISAASERRQPTPIIQICARRGLCRHAALGVQNGGYASGGHSQET
jgi:hypothetical protein